MIDGRSDGAITEGSGAVTAAADPRMIAGVGDFPVGMNVADALLRQAGEAVELAGAEPSEHHHLPVWSAATNGERR